MQFQRAHRRHDHRRLRRESGGAAFDVEELLRAEVRAEARFGHHIIRQAERRLGRNNRIAAVGDVGEGPAVNQRRVALHRLHEIGRQSLFQERRHGPRAVDVRRRNRRALPGVADDDLLQAPLQVGEVFREAEDRHNLRSHRDVEAVFPRKAVARPAEPADDLPQGAVVHIHHPPPCDAPRIQPLAVAPMNVIVQQRGQQVVRRADGVKVPGEMQVDVLHRQHLRIPAPGSPPLHPEARPEARLPQAHRGLLPQPIKRIRQPHGSRRLALPGRSRADRRHQNQPPLFARRALEILKVDLSLVPPIRLDGFRRNVQLGRDVANRLQHRLPRQLAVASLPRFRFAH